LISRSCFLLCLERGAGKPGARWACKLSVISAGPAFERASVEGSAGRACERASFRTPMNDSLRNVLVVEI
jgi:hypothetical protein